MKKILIVLLLGWTTLTWSQASFKPNTGDPEMDNFLHQVNDDAKKDAGAFTGMVTNKFNIAKSDIEKLLKDMAPGDVYMSAEVAAIVGKPVTEVASTYNKNKDKGWGAIAKEMGIKPGSPEFHKLKQSMKKSGGSENDGEGNGAHGNGHGNGHGHGKNK
jgi:hypothetical protein